MVNEEECEGEQFGVEQEGEKYMKQEKIHEKGKENRKQNSTEEQKEKTLELKR